MAGSLIEKYTLQPFDLLLEVRGYKNRVGIMPDNFEGMWIASQAFIVFRHKSNRHFPIFLYMFLKTDLSQSMLETLQSGTGMPLISTKSIRDLRIPVLSSSNIDKVCSYFYREIEVYDQIQHSKREIDKIQENIRHLIEKG